MHAEHGDDDVLGVLSRYVPKHVPGPVWAVVAEPVRRAVAIAGVNPASALTILPVLASHAAWLRAEGHAVDVALFRDRALIERYVQVAMAGAPDASRASRRAILRRVARRLDPAPAPRPEPIRYRRVKPPYQPHEIAGYFAVTDAQPTEARRHSARALLALGLGCGLDRGDLAWVRGIDVTETSCGVAVGVAGGPRPRIVIALDDYADLLLEAGHRVKDGLMIGGETLGRHNVTTPILNRFARDRSLPPLAPTRLRSTWLVRHLDLATPLPVLLAAAGLASSRTLDDLLEYTAPIDADRAARLLRGGHN